MEDTVSSVVGLLCLVAPCLGLFAILGGGIAFFVRRRSKGSQPAASPRPAPPAPQAAPNRMASPTPTHLNSTSSPAQPAPAQAVSVAQPVARADAAALPVAPSELVALRGEAFAPKAGLVNSWQLVGSDTKVAGPALAYAVAAAAFLALEAAGQIHLELGKKKATLGLREVEALYVVPNGSPAQWPTGSYESQIPPMAARLAPDDKNRVQEMVFYLLGEDAPSPWSWGLRQVYQGLAQRGVLEATVKKGILSSGLAKFSLPERTRAALGSQDVQAIQRLFQDCQSSRPAVWDQLNKEIKKAFASRTESADVDFD